MHSNFLPGSDDCLGATMLRANYALQDYLAHLGNSDYNAAYELAMLEAITHPYWQGAATVEDYMRLFNINPSSENWSLVTGAMAAHQYQCKNT